jgi:hypothetical protein
MGKIRVGIIGRVETPLRSFRSALLPGAKDNDFVPG